MDSCSSFAAMANLLHNRKKNRSLVESFLQTQNNISLLLTLPSPSVRMEWVILATNTLCFWLMVSEGPWTVQTGVMCAGVIPISSKAAILRWYEGSSSSSLSYGAFCRLLAWLAAPSRRAHVPLTLNLPVVDSNLMAWSVSSIRPRCM